MRIFGFYLVLISSLSALQSCDTDTELEFSYEQTYCSDPWDNQVQDTMGLWTQEEFFSSYMEAESIIYSNYELVLENSAETCLACSCLSGYVFHITASEEYEEQLLILGFVPN